jgi:SagB-type dehydrogenase family enzyme
MRSIIFSHFCWILAGLFIAMVGAVQSVSNAFAEDPPLSSIKLPAPRTQGTVSVEAAIQLRRSVRHFERTPVSVADVAQLLWAAQGITHSSGLRASPSAGALYPLEVDLVAIRVEGLESGVYRYAPAEHSLTPRVEGDPRDALFSAALGQSALAEAPAVVVISAVYERTTRKYSQRGIRYVQEEAGHAAQSVCLQAVALQLGTVHIGAFQDEEVARVLQLKVDEKPLVLLPVGKAAP